MFLQISFTYIRNISGPKTLPCYTTEVTLTSLDSCPPTLTLCVRPIRKPLALTTILESMPDVANFVSNRYLGTKWKALEKYIIFASIPTT